MSGHAKVFTESTVEGVGQTTVNHVDIDTDLDQDGSGQTIPNQDHVHIDYDLAHQACLAEIASLFEDIQADIRVITDRFDDQTKGIFVRQADTVANNPANIAQNAIMVQALQNGGTIDYINAELGNPTDLANTSPANYAAVRNSGGTGQGYQGAPTQYSQSPGYSGVEGVTLSDGRVVPLTRADDTEFPRASGGGDGTVRYGNQGTKRALPIQQKLWDILETAGKAASVNVLITSGGQVPKSRGGIDGVNRTGSNRHDEGFGADVALYTPDFNGRRLDLRTQSDLSIFLKFMEACRDAGATGIGAGNGYMSDNVIHVDIAWSGQQAGVISGILPNRYWGGGSSTNTRTSTANTPQYLVTLMAPRDNTA